MNNLKNPSQPNYTTLCEAYDNGRYAIITPQLGEYDMERDKNFKRELKYAGFTAWDATGITEEWGRELSYFIPNIDFVNAMILASKFGQEAFIYNGSLYTRHDDEEFPNYYVDPYFKRLNLRLDRKDGTDYGDRTEILTYHGNTAVLFNKIGE